MQWNKLALKNSVCTWNYDHLGMTNHRNPSEAPTTHIVSARGPHINVA